MTEPRWVADFRAKHGRNPAVLHIGNIANNAYCIAKLLRESGVECDVFCNEYYHIMGCPEWEDADFEGDIGDQFHPDWWSVDLRGFRRPKWFVQGPLALAIPYLVAKRQRHRVRAWLWWRALELNRRVLARKGRPASLSRMDVLRTRALALVMAIAWSVLPKTTFEVVFKVAFAVLLFPLWCVWWVLLHTRFGPFLRRITTHESPSRIWPRAGELTELFAKTFPERTDKLQITEVTDFALFDGPCRELFARYDLVQGYATDPFLPLVYGKRPYTAFEHGTLRTFTMGDDQLHRRTALAYNQADHVFITNGDCLEYAKKIKVDRFTPMLHPVDERRIRGIPSGYDALHARYGVKSLLLCPLRHNWAVKGTDGYIRALPALRSKLGASFKILMTCWGEQLGESRALAKELGVDDSIAWIEPVHHAGLYKLLRSVDVLLDQLILPVFGSSAPEGIAAEIPVLMSYDPSYTTWLLPEPAPILTVRTTEDIVKAIEMALDPKWLADYRPRARSWVDRCHSINTVRERHLEVYGSLLSRSGAS